jgi:hypothetical protein
VEELVGDMTMKMMKKRLLVVLAVLALVAGSFLGGALFHSGRAAARTPLILSELIAGKVSGISEYASLEYRYTNVGKFEDQVDFYGWQVPWTTKSFIITYDGVMKLGIKGSGISVQVQGKEVHIKLPAAQLLSHEIYEDKLEVLDQTKNIFNPIQIEDYTRFAADRKQEMEKKAREEGLFQEARVRAEQQLGLFLHSVLAEYEGYTLVFTE